MPESPQSKALVFTDVVDSTRLVAQLGDEQARALWTAHDRGARELLQRCGGREIDRSDGFFLLFDAVADAAQFALAYHVALASLGIAARVGLHVGPVTLRENEPADIARGAKPVEVEGLAKPAAARVMSLARGGQTLLSAAARDALGVALPPDCMVVSHGFYRFRGLAEPLETFELGRRDATAFVPPEDQAKAHRVLRDGDQWRPLRDVPHNLPAERDAFVGRRSELRAMSERLDDGARLVTVTGPGGTGKTRLVRRYGRVWRGDWPGGVHFCDLSEARSLEGVLNAVAVALGVPLIQGDAAVQLGHAISARGRCLLILDNFEQVIEHAAASLGHWLNRAEQASFLVTSRERLHIGGELLMALEPLPQATDAVELFAARAAAQCGDFVLDEHNRSAVMEVVRLLDGLPLAIELAAARARIFSPAELVQRMTDRFRLLAGARGALARQATLKAAIDWSWQLLSPWEQSALAQCAVFDGGFTIKSADAVLDLSSWPDAPPVMDTVQALLDKSLLRRRHPDASVRQDRAEPYFGMYFSIHEYAQAKLDESGMQSRQEAQARHARHYASFGSDEAIESLSLHGGVGRRRSLARELDNLVTACLRAVACGDAESAVGSYRAAWKVLELRGPFAQGKSLGVPVLAMASLAPALRAAALQSHADAARRTDQNDLAASELSSALEICMSLGDRRRQGLVLAELGVVQREQGDFESALRHLDAALVVLREVGHRRAEGTALGSLSNLHHEQGRPGLACDLAEQSLAIHREVGNRGMEGNVLNSLAVFHRGLGRPDRAHACHAAALEIHRELSDRGEEARSLGNLAILLFDQGRHDEALSHYERALALAREVGNRRFEGVVLGNLCNLHWVGGRLDLATQLGEASLALHVEIGNRRSEAIMLSNLAGLHFEQGRAGQALEWFDRALALHREMNNRRVLGHTLAALGELLTSLGRTDEAHRALQEGEAHLREVGDVLELAKLLCIQGRLHAHVGRRDAALAALAEVEAAAVSLNAGPGSLLLQEMSRLRVAVARNDA